MTPGSADPAVQLVTPSGLLEAHGFRVWFWGFSPLLSFFFKERKGTHKHTHTHTHTHTHKGKKKRTPTYHFCLVSDISEALSGGGGRGVVCGEHEKNQLAYTSAKAKINERVGVTHGQAPTFVLLYFCLSSLSPPLRSCPSACPSPGSGQAGPGGWCYSGLAVESLSCSRNRGALPVLWRPEGFHT